MYETIYYKKTFLKEVVFRVDFAATVKALLDNLPSSVAAAALKHFPVSEPQDTMTQQLTVSHQNVQMKTEAAKLWAYHGINREKLLTITGNSLAVRNMRYETFTKFCNDFEHVLHSVFEIEKNLIVRRMGLRYINIVDTPNGDPLAWEKYISRSMLGIIKMHKSNATLCRVFHIVEFNDEGQHTRFQFGIANPDHPAPIKRREFVLDIDSSFVGALTRDEVSTCVKGAHASIQKLFEDSITDKCRKVMGLETTP